jgi:hypothetical protein
MDAKLFSQRCQELADLCRALLPVERIRKILENLHDYYPDFDLPDPAVNTNGFGPASQVRYLSGMGVGHAGDWNPGQVLTKCHINGQDWYLVVRPDGAYLRIARERLRLVAQQS